MMNPKFQDLPKDKERIRERMMELKQIYLTLVQQGAPVSEVDAIRDDMAKLEILCRPSEEQ